MGFWNSLGYLVSLSRRQGLGQSLAASRALQLSPRGFRRLFSNFEGTTAFHISMRNMRNRFARLQAPIFLRAKTKKPLARSISQRNLKQQSSRLRWSSSKCGDKQHFRAHTWMLSPARPFITDTSPELLNPKARSPSLHPRA